MILEARHLRAIEAIHREGTVTAAARRLHLTQSAVSHLVRDLEDRLGVELFVRDRGMELTPEGERLLSAARVVLDELQRAEHDLEQLKAGYRGVLRLTTECYTCYHWLPAILERFRAEFPEVDLQIVPEATSDPVAALLDGALDLAILHRPASDPELVLRELFTDEIVAAVAPDHRLAASSWLDPEDFGDETLILHNGPEDSTVVREFLRPAGVEPRRALALQLSEAVVEAAKSGMGVTVMARWAVSPQVAAGGLVAVPLGRSGLHRTWYAAMPRHRADALAIRALVDLLERDALTQARCCAEPAGPAATA